MSIYALLLLIAGVVFFAYLTGMVEPFAFLKRQLDGIHSQIQMNDILFNSIVLLVFIVVLARVINNLMRREDDGQIQERPIGLGDRRGPERPDGDPR